MDLSLQLDGEVQEVYIKKYDVKVENVSVSLVFECIQQNKSGRISICVGNRVLPEYLCVFEKAQDVLANSSVIDDLLIESTDSLEIRRVLALAIGVLSKSLNVKGEVLIATTCSIEKTYQDVIKSCCAGFSLDSLGFHPKLSFKDNMGMSHINFLEFIMAIEAAFGIDVPDDDIESNVTYGSLLNVIKNHIKD